MIINPNISETISEETPGDALAIVTAFNNRKLDILVLKDVPARGFYTNSTAYGAYLKNVEFSDDVKRIEREGFASQANAQLYDFNKIEYLGSKALTSTSITTPIMDNVKTIDGGVFINCGSLLELNLPAIETLYGVGSATTTFSGCKALEKVTLGENIKIIGDSTLNLRVFSGNSNLTTIHLPASLEAISSAAFYSCVNLTNVTVGEGFNCALNLGSCGDLTLESLENIVGNYADNSGKKLTVTSSTYSLATDTLFTGSELTIAEYASAKGLTIASA